ncbi:ATP synthase mitochondrial F1 complex assembly factor 2 isoform X1 [Patella vulgata]|uniref:ATP synthase mitochondrial F1 complex assembly factor 2 isoform X1 n=1 Tax=Patella vulgata TaxID=6465 RepID=UPI00217F2588|nr:ATP synthase mitochondrial F1 complex assembly factor 2 isoform X1 [Patella vulgata]
MAAPMFFMVRSVLTVSLRYIKQSKLCGYQYNQKKCMSSYRELKKFYKNASIVTTEGWYEINLDKRKLRTPGGNLFRVPNEALALAVATEWNSQDKVIKRHNMHLTSLCNTALDNPFHKTRDVLTDSIIHFLETDTMCYRLTEPEDLVRFQSQNWDPVINWAKDRYKIDITPTYTIAPPDVPQHTKDTIKRHLLSYSDWALFGYQFAVDSVKSLLIIMALVDKFISVDTAVHLSRLEQEYQVKKWGSVEWYHDIDEYELKTRLASATLFIHWSSENVSVKQKASLGIQNIC